MSCWRASQYKDRKQEFGKILLFAHNVVSDQAHFTNNCTYVPFLRSSVQVNYSIEINIGRQGKYQQVILVAKVSIFYKFIKATRLPDMEHVISSRGILNPCDAIAHVEVK